VLIFTSVPEKKTMLTRSSASVVVALLLCVSSIAQEKVTYQNDYRFLVDRIDGIYIPKDIDEAIDSLDTILSLEDKRYIADSLSLSRFLATSHFGIGMWIRNNWGLWSGSRLQRYLSRKNVFHPDDMSGEILKAYYKKKIQGLEYSVEDDIEPDASGVMVRMVGPLESLWYNFKRRFSADYREARRSYQEAKRKLEEDGFAKGETVYFQYPYGCSTAEEQRIWQSATNCDPLPKGKITNVDYGARRIKVKLMETLSPYGIIVFDGDMERDTDRSFERDFDHFTVHSPNRFYMQKGDEMWFDLNSHCWDSWWQ
jgi:hypothetical protein